MATRPSTSEVQAVTDDRILKERSDVVKKYLSSSIAKKYSKISKMGANQADDTIDKMAESVANLGRNTKPVSNEQDAAIREDFNLQNYKVNENQKLLNTWGDLASKTNTTELNTQQGAQNEHNQTREDVVRLQDHYNQDSEAYNKNFENTSREHRRLNDHLDEKNGYYWDNIKRLQSQPVQVEEVISRPGKVREIGTKKEIRRSNVREQRGEQRVIDNKRTENIVSRRTRQQGETNKNQVNYTGNLGIREHNANVRENLITKNYEIVIEKPIFVEKIVNVPYEVIVEKPVENIIEKEVIYEKIIEIPVERIIEKEVEEIVEQEKEVLVERAVYTERYVDNPIERVTHVNKEVIVEKEVEIQQEVEKVVQRRIARPRRDEIQVREVIVEEPQIVEEIVERTVNKPYTTYRDIEDIQYVDKVVDRYVDKIIEVEKFVDREVVEVRQIEDVQEHIVTKRIEKPVIREVLIEEEFITVVKKPVRRTVRKEVKVEVLQEREEIEEITQYVDKEVIVDIDNPIAVERIVEIEKTIDVIEEIQVPTKREVIVEKEVEVEQPVFRKIAKYVEIPVEKYVDKEIEKEVIIYVDQEVIRTVIIDKKVPKIVEKEVVVEIPVIREVEKIVEIVRIVERPIYVDKVVTKEIPKIVEKIVEVKVPKYKEIKVEKRREKIIEQIIEIENPVYIEQENEEIVNIMDTGKNERLRKSYRQNVDRIGNLEVEIKRLEIEATEAIRIRKSVKRSTRTGPTTVVGKEENNLLREELDQLHQSYTQILERNQKRKNQEVITNTQPRRSVRRSQMPMEIKKSVIHVENDEKKYYETNQYGQKVEISEAEYLRLKAQSGQGGKRIMSSSNAQEGVVLNYSNRNGSSNGGNVVRYSNRGGANTITTNGGYTEVKRSSNRVVAGPRKSTLYIIKNGQRIPITQDEYNQIQRESGIYEA